MTGRLRRLVALCACTLVISCGGGATRLERKVGPRISDVDATAPYLKLHLRDGEVYVLSRWTMEGSTGTIAGFGGRWGQDRTRRDAADMTYRIELREVALFETNTPYSSPVNRRMGILTGVSVALSVVVVALFLAFASALGSGGR